MEVFCGCSGWYYDWNLERSLDWYVKNSKLNAIELNASFYRFPFPNQVKSWAKKGKSLRWSIKVNRLITHQFKFSTKAFQIWKKFEALFEPIKENIDFYLFQLPPSCSEKMKDKIAKFYKKTKLKERFALEPRHQTWFSTEIENWAKNLGLTLVSVDSPDFPKVIFNSDNLVYVRMHGRTFWYSHCYSGKELNEIAEKITAINPKKAYIFFNNDHDMLKNAQKMFKTLKQKN